MKYNFPQYCYKLDWEAQRYDFTNINYDRTPKNKKTKKGKIMYNSYNIQYTEGYSFTKVTEGNAIDEIKEDIQLEENLEKYCFCNNPTNGDMMIGCDSKDCKIVWFHCGCVGIDPNNIPDKWLCPECSSSQVS